jgi:hypothetical protein
LARPATARGPSGRDFAHPCGTKLRRQYNAKKQLRLILLSPNHTNNLRLTKFIWVEVPDPISRSIHMIQRLDFAVFRINLKIDFRPELFVFWSRCVYGGLLTDMILNLVNRDFFATACLILMTKISSSFFCGDWFWFAIQDKRRGKCKQTKPRRSLCKKPCITNLANVGRIKNPSISHSALISMLNMGT